VSRPSRKPVPKKARRRHFLVEMTVSVELEVAETVFEQVLTDEWRGQFYPLHSRDDLVEHLAFNLLKGHRLSMLDGFANLADDLVVMSSADWDVGSCVEEG
jgi:hypothetical protein